MTEAEAKLIEGAIRWRAMHPAAGPSPYTNDIDAVIQEREDAYRRHPYGSIAESMMASLRDHPNGRWPRTNRDVCDPARREPYPAGDNITIASGGTGATASVTIAPPKHRLFNEGKPYDPPPPGDPPYQSQALRSLRTDGKVPNTDL